MKYLVDFREAEVGGAVVPGRVVRPHHLRDQLGTEDSLRQQSNITFLIHGYNVNRTAGITSFLALAQNLSSSISGAVVAILWPGDHWSGILSYPFEGNDADDTALELVRFIDLMFEPGATFSFVTHSLGARVAMEVIVPLVRKRYHVQQICLLAAAIDDHSLAAPISYRQAVIETERVTVLASANDRVLKYAYPLGDFFESFIFMTDSATHPLGLHGPKSYRNYPVPHQVYHEQISEQAQVGHDDYIPHLHHPNQKQRSTAQFVNQVIQGNNHPVYTITSAS